MNLHLPIWNASYPLHIIYTVFGQNKTEEPAVFIDSNLIARNAIEYINPNEIESVNVIKKDTFNR
jgi:hypothetical protein